ncbi:hypothetical protein BVC80_1069g9 [Macleaya cordata]|uniref:DNA repair RAD52-like protein 2, chloroplastic n=1 Tax=Macleaya cordata TaxID=56857 RepID=A0A200RCL4_MACCD|nr:hypothetical protein BVC80_1069g9 [Macleaya cordata]
METDMALRSTSFLSKPVVPVTDTRIPAFSSSSCSYPCISHELRICLGQGRNFRNFSTSSLSVIWALEKKHNWGRGNSYKKAAAVPNSNYVVPLDKSSCITRPLAEILRDLNKKVPDKIIKPDTNCIIPWYHANRMLSFYAPGWCGEIRDIIYSENGNVTVVYRVTIRGSDGEAYRESAGTIFSSDGHNEDPVAAAEEIAFGRACARFGLGLYLYHEDETL